jgi:hypothetical protein
MRDQILNGYGVGDQITHPSHIAVLEDLLRRKPTEGEKVGPGISYWFVDSTSNYRDYVTSDARSIAIMRTDGTIVDFGYTKVINDEGHVDDVKEALRYAVQDKRDQFKLDSFSGGPVYDDRGDQIENTDEAEVRYENPNWGELTADFADSVGGWEAIDTDGGGGSVQIGERLVNSEIEKRWRDYYDDHAFPYISRKGSTRFIVT